jgi:multidrug efflux pump subunit AcrA (membrane-fusion protein)
VDAATRTTPVRIVTQNPEGLLKKDMFVEAVIHTSGSKNLLAVPVSAVLRDDKNEPIVYVQAQPGKARILEQEHRIYSEAPRIAIAGNYRIEGRRVIPG